MRPVISAKPKPKPVPVPPAALAQVRAYLATSAPPFDFGKHFDTLDPDCPVLVGAHVMRCRDTTRALYALNMGKFVQADPRPVLGATFDLETVLAWKPDETGATMVVALVEQ